MRFVFALSIIVLLLSSCSKNEGKLLPGEKYTVDTIMYREYRKIDSIANIECGKVSDAIFRKAYDSLLRIRVHDISSIKGTGIPPKDNKFPEAVEQLKKADTKK